jgi:hypothetical protein
MTDTESLHENAPIISGCHAEKVRCLQTYYVRIGNTDILLVLQFDGHKFI